MNMQIIIAPLVGCVIGYFTNWLAIKMLFRPLTAKYIGKWRVPLTPGLIPKEKARIAQVVGEVISKNLLSPETIQDALLSPEMEAKIEGGIDALIEAHRADERTLHAVIADAIGDEALDEGSRTLRAGVADVLSKKLIEANVGDTAAQAIAEHLKKRAPSALGALVSGLLDERLKQGITRQLGEFVNNFIETNAQQMLSGAVDAETDKLLALRVCDLIGQHQGSVQPLKDKLMLGYRSAIRAGAERALGAIDLAAIIQARIAALNELELETLLLQVIDRELKAIVYLGALLGFIMGFANLLFS